MIKIKAKKTLGILGFLIGFAFLLYPMISRTYYDFYYRKESSRISERLASDEFSETIYQEQVEYNQTEISKPEEIEVAEVQFVEEAESAPVDATQQPDYFANKNLIGTLSIPSIDLIYPIYDGATHQNLLDGVARIEGTDYPVGGLNTNSVIAGHNGLVGRTYFSHIKHLVSGDRIKIQNRKELLTYEVYKTATIEPTDLSALSVVPGQDTVTLLTCTWPPPGTHRYLVYGRRVPNAENETLVSGVEETESVENKEEEVEFNLFMTRYGTILFTVVIGLLVMYLIFIR